MPISVDAVVCVVRPPIEVVVLLPGLDDSQHVGQQFEGGCRLDGNDRHRVYHECLHPVRDTCDLAFFWCEPPRNLGKGKTLRAGWVGGAALVVSLPSPGSSSARSTYSHRLILFRSVLEMVGLSPAPLTLSPRLLLLSAVALRGEGVEQPC